MPTGLFFTADYVPPEYRLTLDRRSPYNLEHVRYMLSFIDPNIDSSGGGRPTVLGVESALASWAIDSELDDAAVLVTGIYKEWLEDRDSDRIRKYPTKNLLKSLNRRIAREESFNTIHSIHKWYQRYKSLGTLHQRYGSVSMNKEQWAEYLNESYIAFKRAPRKDIDYILSNFFAVYGNRVVLVGSGSDSYDAYIIDDGVLKYGKNFTMGYIRYATELVYDHMFASFIDAGDSAPTKMGYNINTTREFCLNNIDKAYNSLISTALQVSKRTKYGIQMVGSDKLNNTDNLVAWKNGVFRISDGKKATEQEILEARLITRYATEFHPDAEDVNLDQKGKGHVYYFLKGYGENSEELLQYAARQLISPLWQGFIILFGNKNTGKSSFLKALTSVFGIDETGTIAASTFHVRSIDKTTRDGLAPFFEKRFGFTEQAESIQFSYEGKINGLIAEFTSGNIYATERNLYKSAATRVVRMQWWISTNQILDFNSNDTVMQKRMRVFKMSQLELRPEFENMFKMDNLASRYLARLLMEEAKKIRNSMEKAGLSPADFGSELTLSDARKEALADWQDREEVNWFATWLRTCFRQRQRGDITKVIPTDSIQDMWGNVVQRDSRLRLKKKDFEDEILRYVNWKQGKSKTSRGWLVVHLSDKEEEMLEQMKEHQGYMYAD